MGYFHCVTYWLNMACYLRRLRTKNCSHSKSQKTTNYYNKQKNLIFSITFKRIYYSPLLEAWKLSCSETLSICPVKFDLLKMCLSALTSWMACLKTFSWFKSFGWNNPPILFKNLLFLSLIFLRWSTFLTANDFTY